VSPRHALVVERARLGQAIDGFGDFAGIVAAVQEPLAAFRNGQVAPGQELEGVRVGGQDPNR
jgi:hypothetical protein